MVKKSLKSELERELEVVGGLPLTHDKLFREVFQWIELAKAFLKKVLPKVVLERLDIDGLTVEPKDFLSLLFRETRADMIYRIPIHGSERSLCVYVLLEHKSYNDFLTIFQADQYAGQIGQEEIRKAQDEKRLTIDFRLSPVLVIIFHHGESAFTGPTDVADVYDDYGFMDWFVPHRRALLFDLSVLPESDVPDDPETPELYVVLRIMQEIFSTDIGTKSRVLLERLKPYSEIPKYRRLIRFLWFYLLSSARRMTKREMMSVTDTVKKVIGEKDMSTVLEQLKAEWEAEGETNMLATQAETILTFLRARFKRVSKSVEDRVRKVKDKIVLDSLAAHAATCETLDEFATHLP